MIAVETFKFLNGTLRCAGGEVVVQDIYNYFNLRNNNRQSIDMQQFIDRIINNGVYARLEPKGIVSKLRNIIYGYNRQLKKNSLYITQAEYIEAAALAFPERACDVLKMTRLDYQVLKETTIWRKRLDID